MRIPSTSALLVAGRERVRKSWRAVNLTLLPRSNRQKAELPTGLPQHGRGPGQGQRGHEHRNQQIRPCPPSAEHSKCGEADRDVADGIIARADPDRTHVGVALAMAIEQNGHAAVGDQGKDCDDPIVDASGMMPVCQAQTARPNTRMPKAALQAALKIAVLEQTCSAIDSTASDRARGSPTGREPAWVCEEHQ